MIGIIFAVLAFETSVQEAKVETERLQEGLTNRCSLVQYSSLVRMSGGNAVWTDALQCGASSAGALRHGSSECLNRTLRWALSAKPLRN